MKAREATCRCRTVHRSSGSQVRAWASVSGHRDNPPSLREPVPSLERTGWSVQQRRRESPSRGSGRSRARARATIWTRRATRCQCIQPLEAVNLAVSSRVHRSPGRGDPGCAAIENPPNREMSSRTSRASPPSGYGARGKPSATTCPSSVLSSTASIQSTPSRY